MFDILEMAPTHPSILRLVVVDTRVLSVEHIMIGERKASDDTYMVSIIRNIERISPIVVSLLTLVNCWSVILSPS